MRIGLRLFVHASVLLAPGLGFGLLSAQAPKDVDVPPLAQTPAHNSVAIIVGIEQYQQHAPNVPHAVHDAQTVRDYLIKVLGFDARNVLFITDADATSTRLKALPNRAKTLITGSIKEQQIDLLLFYYAGHGMPDQATQANYLVPSDADLADIALYGYPLRQLYADLAALPAKRVLVILDSCFSGTTARGSGEEALQKGTRPGVIINEAAVPDSVAVLSAASGSQVSGAYDPAGHGLFTYYLLRGLRGEGALDPDGWVSLAGVDRYVEDRVREESLRLGRKEQTPQLQAGAAIQPASFRLARVVPPKYGSLELTVDVGAEVILDNEPRGSAVPEQEFRQQRLVPGVHDIELRHPGYQTVREQVTIKPEQAWRKNYKLTPAVVKVYGAIQVMADAGGSLSIDGGDRVELTPFATYTTGSILPGTHRVRIEKAGYEVAERDVEVSPNQTAKAEFRLMRQGQPPLPDAVVGRIVPIGSIIELWLESQAAGPTGESGIIEADLQTAQQAWQVSRIRGAFPGKPVTVTGECTNCTLKSIVEAPGPTNKFLRARARIEPINVLQPIRFRLLWQILKKGKR
jgi:hypothetical protein